jgi:hypothetical protein
MRMAEWLMKLRCLITGGHRYSNINLLMMKDPFKPEYIFTNECLKCGKTIHLRISKVVFDGILEADLRRKRAEDDFCSYGERREGE